MQSTTASNEDTVLIEAIETAVMQNWERLHVQLSRIGLPGSGVYSWQVGFKAQFDGHDCEAICTGGGVTFREALQAAFVARVAQTLDR